MTNTDLTYQITRKTVACKATLNGRSIIQSNDNYVTDPTRSLIEHVQDIYEKYRDCELKIEDHVYQGCS